MRDHSLIALSCAIEVLRMVNRLFHQEMYEWKVVNLDTQYADFDGSLWPFESLIYEGLGPEDVVFFVGGTQLEQELMPEMIAAARRLAAQKVILGSLCSGGQIIAAAGLLDGYRVAAP